MEADDEGGAVEPATTPTPQSAIPESSLATAGLSTSATTKEECSEKSDKRPGDDKCGQGMIPEGGGIHLHAIADGGDFEAEEEDGGTDDDLSSDGDDDDDGDSFWNDDPLYPQEGKVDSDEESSSNEEDGVGLVGEPESGDEDGEGDTGIRNQEGEGSSSSNVRSESGSGDDEGQLHPMKNPLILKNMFELCPPSLLANFRLVCKQWRDLCLTAWRSSITLRFGHSRDGKVVLRVGGPPARCPYGNANANVDDHVRLEDFLDYVETPKNQCLLKRFRRFKFRGFTFPLTEIQEPAIKKLTELLKRDATVLELERCSFPDIEVFKEVICTDWPNLQELKFRFRDISDSSLLPFDDEILEPAQKEPISVGVYPEHLQLKSLVLDLRNVQDMEKFPLSWLELFSQYPVLTRLSLTARVGYDHQEFPIPELLRVLEAVKSVRIKDPRKLPFKQFVLYPELKLFVDDEVLSLLRELSIPLLSLKLRMDDEEGRNLQEMFGAPAMNGSQLESLNIYRKYWGIFTWKCPFAVPLENLQELIMNSIIWEGDMEFLKLVPNLRRLELLDIESSTLGVRSRHPLAMMSNTIQHKMADVKLLKMTDFTCNYALSEDDLRHFADWFPNLRRLQAGLNDKLFAVVCERWVDLESLKVIGDALTDEGVTGLRADQIVEGPDMLELPPNIKLLQNLKRFEYPEGEMVTDVSIFNGFLKLPRLNYLHLGRANGLSEMAKSALVCTGGARGHPLGSSQS